MNYQRLSTRLIILWKHWNRLRDSVLCISGATVTISYNNSVVKQNIRFCRRGLIHYTLLAIDHVGEHCIVPTGCNELDPYNCLVATKRFIGYNSEHTTLATSHGFGTTTTVVVSIEGLKGVVTRICVY